MKINTKEREYKLLDKSCIDQLLQVQEEAFEYAKGDTDFLRRNTYETFSVCFGEKSAVIGAYFKGEMIAFGILFAAGEDKENLAKDVDEIQDITQSANVKLVIVRPAFRGNGLQRELVKRMEDSAKKSGFKWLCTTVSPTNKWSYDNCIKSGFKQVKILVKYGGLTRALLVKEI